MPTSTPSDPPPPPAPPGPVGEFDEFYLTSRPRLVLETYALTGDLSAASSAVRDAFVAASQHWDKVGRLADPEGWVRPRAWAMARRRRHVGHRRHYDQGLTDTQSSVLDALHRLPDQQRKVLLLTHLAGQSADQIGRELGEPPDEVTRLLATACVSFDRDARAALESLAPIAEATSLPRPHAVGRGARRRRRLQLVTAVVILLALTLGAGAFVTAGTPEAASAKSGSAKSGSAGSKPVTEEMLLSLPQVQGLTPPQGWRILSTSDNTSGTGLNTVCQDARFADPQGRGAFVRTFANPGPPNRNYLQTVEVSRTPAAATAAYRTTLGWFAGCGKARMQLLSSYRVEGLGEEAQLLKLRSPGPSSRTYVVGLARSGSLTVSTVLETLGGRQLRLGEPLGMLTTALRNVCSADASGPCPVTVAAAPVLPPPSGETPGTLATGDLPVVGRITAPWVGTRPKPARPNVAATTCDRTNFVRSGSPTAMTRTFLIPQAGLPRRFGLTETYGAFPNPRRAAAVVRGATADMRTCEKRDLSAQVSSEVVRTQGYRGSEYALWRLDSEVEKGSTVGFWMGLARVGSYVAQVNFTPTGKNDIDEVTFQTLMTRARDRLFELPPVR